MTHSVLLAPPMLWDTVVVPYPVEVVEGLEVEPPSRVGIPAWDITFFLSERESQFYLEKPIVFNTTTLKLSTLDR